VVDAHHHIGTDVDGHENSPTGPTGSYSYCRKIINGDGVNLGLRAELEKNEKKYDWTLSPDRDIIDYYPLMQQFELCDETLSDKYGFDETLAMDQIIVFPMHDKFRMKDKVEYRASNKLIQQWTDMYPHSLRFLGFGRVNPKDDLETAVKELKRFVRTGGLRGVKLHPNSEDFLMDSPNVKRILREATLLGVPVIFHTTYAHEVKALYDTVNEIIVEMFHANGNELLPRLKVIIGHCTYQSEDVYLALSHPNIYGELSTLNKPNIYLNVISQNVGIKRFFEETIPELQEKYPDITQEKMNKIYGYNLPYLDWHNKIMLGTDHPYMPVTHTIDLIKALLSKKSKLDVGPKEIQNLLGANILRLVPPKFALSKLIPNSNNIPSNSHREFIQYLVNEKKKVLGLDPILGNTPLLPMKQSDAVVTIMDDSKHKTSFLLTAVKLKSASPKGKESVIETILEIGENDEFLKMIDLNKYPRQLKNDPLSTDNFLHIKLNV
jgi:predicted TIM-barrel fold metal-dependent hydrolase